jgi:FlaG/FlaF family flagellin (archaellin)
MITTRNFQANDSAISPISEIIIIAVVVILGAIIATFFLGTGENIQQQYVIEIAAKQTDADKIIVTFYGGKEANKVLFINVSVNGYYSNGSTGWDNTTELNTFDGDGINPIETGNSRNLTDVSGIAITRKMDHVVVVGKFIDGTMQVVLNTYV